MLIFVVVSPILLVLSLLLAIVFLPKIVTEQRVKEELVSALTSALHTKVEIGELRYNVLTGIEIRGLRIGPPKGFSRDVLTIDRIALHYDLSKLPSRRLTIHEAVIERPHVSIEVQGASTNLDAFRSPAPKEKPPSKPLEGPLSPIDLVLERAAITNLLVEMTGDGPQLSFGGAALEAHAELISNRLKAVFLPAVGEKGAPSRIKLQFPARGSLVSGDVDLALTSSLAIAADTRDGIAIDEVALGLRTEVKALLQAGEQALPIAELGFQVGVRVSPKEDRAELSPFSARVQNQTLASGAGRVEGLYALLEDQVGSAAAKALARQIGLFKRAPEGIVRVSIAELALPLTQLAPFVAVFRRDMAVYGRIALRPIEIEGRLPELVRGEPRRLSVGLVMEDVAFHASTPPADMERATGRIDLERRAADPGGRAATFGAHGQIALDRIAYEQNRIQHAEIGVDAELARLAAPIAGPLRAKLDLSARGIAAPRATVDALSTSFEVSGDDVLASRREGLPPIGLVGRVSASRIETRSATAAIALSGVVLDVRAAVDRLLPYAEKPVDAKVDLVLRGVEVKGAAPVRLEDMRVSLAAGATDPRHGGPIDVDAKLSAGIARATTAQADLADARFTLSAGAKGIEPRTLPAGDAGARPVMVPASLAFAAGLALPAIDLHHPTLGNARSKLDLALDGTVNPPAGTVTLRSFALAIGDAIKLKASGRAKDVLSASPWIDARLDVEPIDLERAIAAVPPGALASLPGLRASGKVGFSARATGLVPRALGRTDLEHPPIEASGELKAEAVSASVPSRQISLEGLDGSLGFELQRGGSALTAAWKLQRAVRGDGKTSAEAKDLSLELNAGLRDHVWQILGRMKAQRLASGVGARQAVEGAHVDLDATYPARGDLELRKLEIAIPGSGIDLSMEGRLTRRRFGVLRPEGSVKAALDLDRLRALAPEIGDAHGKVDLELDVESRIDTRLWARGRLDLDGFSYQRPGLVSVKNASGRIPVDQLVALPAPSVREEVAASEGVLGEDLEARIAELQRDLGAFRLYLDSDDILARPPRTADYDALRPYYQQTGAHLTIDELVLSGQPLRAITFEGLWRSGVFRIDRFAASVWEGDVIGDIAVQITADQNVRTRARLTMTGLNFDIPYSLALHQPAVTDPSEKEKYKVSGTLDFKFGWKEHEINAQMDLTKLRKPSVERLFDIIYKGQKNPAGEALADSGKYRVEPNSGKISIVHNLLFIEFGWDRILLDVGFPWMRSGLGESFPKSLIMTPIGLALDLTGPVVPYGLGSIVIDVVNSSNQGSLSAWNFLPQERLNPMIDGIFERLTGHMVASEGGLQASSP